MCKPSFRSVLTRSSGCLKPLASSLARQRQHLGRIVHADKFDVLFDGSPEVQHGSTRWNNPVIDIAPVRGKIGGEFLIIRCISS